MNNEAKKNPIAFINSHLKKMGLQPWKSVDKNPTAFFDYVYKHFKINLMTSTGDSKTFYSILNSNLSLSNVCSSQFDKSRIEAVTLAVIQSEFDIGDNMLEIGCGNGIFTCLMGILYPNTHIIGIDPCENSISIAKQRANILGIKNIDFQVNNLENFLASYDSEKFDSIFAITSMQEALESYFTSCNVDIVSNSKSNSLLKTDVYYEKFLTSSPLFLRLVKQLVPNGILITVDRRDTAPGILEWIRITESVGLHPVLKKSKHLIEQTANGIKNKLTMTVCLNQTKGRIKIGEVLSFLAKSELEKTRIVGVHNGTLAEALFVSMGTPIRVKCSKFEYFDKSKSGEILIGYSGAIGFIYISDDADNRELDLFLLEELEERISDFEQRCSRIKTVASLDNVNSEQVNRII
ncbi:methyltransferase domain-containing protein [Holophaga foetida]|uniref:methyltransferase domain-containing protein n=1 Tax=Holophaga foetida TaxID=35839 RepID=UPI00024742A1|nr:class I SAM-dependent methyltransferase [Holophaga foetida]